MKILLIEDEKIERITMENALNMHFPDVLVKSAASSIEALALYAQMEPDIVISDINIPGGKSGLEVIREMKQMRECLFLIVTSYSYFDYIQQAIRLGIDGFLLKPLREGVLVQNVTQLIKQYEQKCAERNRRGALYEKLNEMMPILKRNLFYAIMQNDTPYEIQSALQYLEWNCTDAICIVVPERAFSEANVFVQLLGYRFPHMKCLYNRYEQHFVLYILKDGRFVDNEMQGLQDELDEVFGGVCEVKISGFVSGCEHFYSLYHLAIYASEEQRIRYIDFAHEETLNLDEFSDELISLLYEKKQTEARYKLQAFEDYLQYFSEKEAAQYLYRLVETLGAKISGLETQELWKKAAMETTVHRRLMVLLETLYESLQERRGRRISEKVNDYIAAHYMHQISLQSLAGYLNLTPFYVSRLVKEETGSTFTDLLAGYRIEKSKEKLRHNMKIKDAALSCGFVDVNYFSKVFKKLTGVSPKEFQRTERL